MQIVAPIKDIVSKTHGNNDGYTHCGKRAAHIFDSNTGEEIDISGSSEITLIGDRLILFDLTKEGNYTYNLSYSLVNYPQIPWSSK